MSRMSKIFSRKGSRPTTVNRDGYPAYERPLEEQYVQTLLTNTMGRTFYADANELIDEALELHDQMIAHDPGFVGKALVYARQHGYMRAQPIVGLVALAMASSTEARAAFETAFNGVIRTPGDLTDFVSTLRALKGGEGGRRIKRVVSRWLVERVDEYRAIKYGSAGRKGTSLGNVIRAYHPPHREIFRYLRGHDADLAQLPKIAAFEALKRASTEAEKAEAIRAGRLPHEVVTPFIGKSAALWSTLVDQMPVMALMRNLATLERHGALEANREKIESVFTNREIIERSKVLPFRFATAAKKVTTAWAKDALRDALELSFANLAEIPGRTAVFLDISSSMSGRYLEIGSIFALALMKKANLNGRFLLFDTRVTEFTVSKRDSILSQAEKIGPRGGTDTGAPMRKLTLDRDKVDTIILITDEQQNTGSPFYDALVKYRKTVNRLVDVYVVDIAPYRSAVTPDDDRVHYIYGWSERVIDFIAMNSRGWSSAVNAIRSGS